MKGQTTTKLDAGSSLLPVLPASIWAMQQSGEKKRRKTAASFLPVSDPEWMLSKQGKSFYQFRK